jgi:heat-inducible transcriptional repressor
MVASVDLDLRQRSILAALVYEYIATGEPVGSRTLTRHHVLGVSAATVRNSMTDLEEMGLVMQPHTSAGRVPTDSGIRLFVDSLMEMRQLSPTEQSLIEERYGDVLLSSDGWSRVVRMLSEMTRHPAIVQSPTPNGLVMRQLRFVPLGAGQVLAVLLSASGLTESRVLQLEEELDPSTLERVHNYINEVIPGRSLAEARQTIEREIAENSRNVDALFIKALELGRDVLDDFDEEPRLIVHGQATLVREGTSVDVERLRQLMELLDDQKTLASLLEATIKAQGPFIVIGGEHPVTEVAGCSIIAAPYSFGSEAWGTLAVIGPRSMDYATMVPLVGFTARVLSLPDDDDVE